MHGYKWSCSCRHTGGARGPAKGRQREREIELEAVIENLKRVIEKQQAEAEHLRKTGTTNAKYQPTVFVAVEWPVVIVCSRFARTCI